MKKISDILKQSNTCLFSFEFFPPKTNEGEIKFFQTLKEISKLNPAFVSVTYGAGGSTKEKTIELSEKINKENMFPAMCHFTCVSVNSEQIEKTLHEINSKGISNLMALRGDPPAGEGIFQKTTGGFSNATELIQFIKEKKFNFSIAGGCYPEKHPETKTMEEEIFFLSKKVEAGAEFLITQLFFSNPVFEKYRELAIRSNVEVPIIPGIMPITDFKQIERFKKMTGCNIPENFVSRLEKFKENPDDFLKVSLDFTTHQCLELMKSGVKGLHFYTLNQSKTSYEIVKNLT
ncbi:MAG: methylenetetrahydrofolate reductase [NAD(P)H] [Leptospiraceae bacterium]|nr:methylenetetrahydrofolate reductase [NAD(P)H] [Leptospiraceae bacterium]MCK6380899.1 methylenetetrahydrofolate reductase [NAD(P)H] [Leptospiraceae bacterium]NUM40046.1 methylenetetrahydrofolate reductase [NAD(P)H] [Leptospiraceae bacterium]